MIPKQNIVSQTVRDKIIEEVTVLMLNPEITVVNVIQTEFNSQEKKTMDTLWKIKKMKAIQIGRVSVRKLKKQTFLLTFIFTPSETVKIISVSNCSFCLTQEQRVP